MRGLIPWDVYHELTSWHRDIDDLFRRFFSRDANEGASLSSAWVPAMECFERNGQYVIRADLPGVKPEELEVSVANDVLVLKGERKQASEVNDRDYFYKETAYGKFERRVQLPKGVDRDKITARFENGVLEIAAPLPKEASSRIVPIETTVTQQKKLAA